MAFRTSKLWANDGFHSPKPLGDKNLTMSQHFHCKTCRNVSPPAWWVDVLLESLGVAVAGPEGLVQSSREVESIGAWLGDAHACVPSLLRNQHKAAADRGLV